MLRILKWILAILLIHESVAINKTYNSNELDGILPACGKAINFTAVSRCIVDIIILPHHGLGLYIESADSEVSLISAKYPDKKVHLGLIREKIVLPAGTGVVLKRKSYSLLKFSRNVDSETCPEVIVAENGTDVKTIELNHLQEVCGMRILTNRTRIALKAELNNAFIELRNVGQRFPVIAKHTKSFGWLPYVGSSIDVVFRKSVLTQESSLKFSIVSLDYDPCRCTHQESQLHTRDKFAISSPGYPNSFCSTFNCTYKFTSADDEDDEETTGAFIINNTVSTPFASNISYAVQSDGEYTPVSSHAQERQSSSVTLIGKTLLVNIAATNGGSPFILTVEKKTVKYGCECPSAGFKILPETGIFNMTIDRDCLEMHCTFKVPASMDMLHFVTNYKLASDSDVMLLNSKKISTGDSREGAVAYSSVPQNKSVTIEFRRDAPVPFGPASFSISWKQVKYPCACPDYEYMASNNWKEMTSSYYPSRYCPNMDCQFRITAKAGYKVVLSIRKLDTEPHVDQLKIYDNDALIETLHGRISKPREIALSSNTAKFHFTSDANFHKTGFIIRYWRVKA